MLGISCYTVKRIFFEMLFSKNMTGKEPTPNPSLPGKGAELPSLLAGEGPVAILLT